LAGIRRDVAVDIRELCSRVAQRQVFARHARNVSTSTAPASASISGCRS
jgi:hypothetical protein